MKKFILLMLLSASCMAQTGYYTGDMTKYQNKISWVKCVNYYPAPSYFNLTLNPDGTMVQDAGGVITNGYWSFIDSKHLKIRFDYTGNELDQSGDWWIYYFNLTKFVDNYCGTSTLYQASVRVKRADIIYSTTGVTKFVLQVEFYGYSNMLYLDGKGLNTVTSTGTMVWN